MKKTKKISIASIASTRLTNFISRELFFQPLKNDWNTLFNTQMFSLWNKFSTNTRRFQQVRAELSFKSTQFSLAVDSDQYGKKPITKNLDRAFC